MANFLQDLQVVGGGVAAVVGGLGFCGFFLEDGVAVCAASFSPVLDLLGFDGARAGLLVLEVAEFVVLGLLISFLLRTDLNKKKSYALDGALGDHDLGVLPFDNFVSEEARARVYILGGGHYVFLSVLRCRKQIVLLPAGRAELLGVLLQEGLVFLHGLENLPLEIEPVSLHGLLDLELVVIVGQLCEDPPAVVVALSQQRGTVFCELPMVFWFSAACLSKVRRTFLFPSIIILTHIPKRV